MRVILCVLLWRVLFDLDICNCTMMTWRALYWPVLAVGVDIKDVKLVRNPRRELEEAQGSVSYKTCCRGSPLCHATPVLFWYDMGCHERGVWVSHPTPLSWHQVRQQRGVCVCASENTATGGLRGRPFQVGFFTSTPPLKGELRLDRHERGIRL